jgi:glucosamine--fructose-6-phosphate aminotransferase (isomerizing)
MIEALRTATGTLAGEHDPGGRGWDLVIVHTLQPGNGSFLAHHRTGRSRRHLLAARTRVALCGLRRNRLIFFFSLEFLLGEVMCGIVAYCGRASAVPALLGGLNRLEYRGYDSAGIALLHRPAYRLGIERAAGRLASLLEALPDSSWDTACEVPIGIGHTRWATHGEPTAANAHPHRDCTATIAVVHNGTIDNAAALTDQLTATGHRIDTEVDTELIAHLIEDHLHGVSSPATHASIGAGTATTEPGDRAGALGRLADAVAAAVEQLQGSWALAVIAQGVPGVVLARHRSQLLVGVTPTTLTAASDTLGLCPLAEAIRELCDGDIVTLAPGRELHWRSAGGRWVDPPAPLRLSVQHIITELEGAPDYTGKEIAEQPAVAARILDAISGRLTTARLLGDLGIPDDCVRVRLLACGSSYYAAAVTARMLTQFAGVPAQAVIASEHADDACGSDVLTVAFSQSGETADLLAAREHGHTGPWMAITNNPHSTLARCCDAVFDLDCGPELAVAATKSFTAQVVAGAAFALALGAARGTPDVAEWERVLLDIPDRLAATDVLARPVAVELARGLAHQPGWVYTSRGAGMPYAQEGALKLKELAYRWTEALPAGELKHGPIALITSGVPVIAVLAQPAARLAVNTRELAARGAHIITVGGAGHDAVLPAVLPTREPPWGPLESVVALQHLAREVTVELGHDVDRPRNLAKSVTVE